MYLDTDFPPGGGRLAPFMRMIDAFERDDIETAVDALIARLDIEDARRNPDEPDFRPCSDLQPGEPLDAEDDDADEGNGDEEDGDRSEDDFMEHAPDGPGCPVADPDHGAEETLHGGGGDPSWTEWQTRGRHKVDQHGAEIVGRDRHGNMLHEDAEDDDPAEDSDSDRCLAGDDEIVSGPVVMPYGWHSWVKERIGNEEDAEPDTDAEHEDAI